MGRAMDNAMLNVGLKKVAEGVCFFISNIRCSRAHRLDERNAGS